MELIFEILKIVLPAIITGFSTFIITKYTYNKNIPIDKLEISYNRIYYPLFELMRSRNNKNKSDYKIYLDLMICEAEWRLKKYRKYADKSTLRTFNLLCSSNTQVEKEANLLIFENNIYDKSVYLRRRLGYLEPNLFQSYRYASYSEKATYRSVIEFGFICIFIILTCVFTGYLQKVFGFLTALIASIFFLEIAVIFLRFLYYKFSEKIELFRSSKK